MDWLKHFIIYKFNNGVQINGLKQGLHIDNTDNIDIINNVPKNHCSHLDHLNEYGYIEYEDNTKHGKTFTLYSSGDVRYLFNYNNDEKYLAQYRWQCGISIPTFLDYYINNVRNEWLYYLYLGGPMHYNYYENGKNKWCLLYPDWGWVYGNNIRSKYEYLN